MDDIDRKEQRKHERFPFREHILIEGTKACTSIDISMGGIYISAMQTFEKDRVVDITIPFKDKKITLKGQVQYYQAGIGIGLNFIDLTSEQKAIIQELIDSIRKTSH